MPACALRTADCWSSPRCRSARWPRSPCSTTRVSRSTRSVRPRRQGAFGSPPPAACAELRTTGELGRNRSVTSPDGGLVTDSRAAGELTRRALLGTAAAAGAASLVFPTDGLASALIGSTGISNRWVGTLGRGPVTIAAPARFGLVGVEWRGPRAAQIELRTFRPGNEWGRWALASIL